MVVVLGVVVVVVVAEWCSTAASASGGFEVVWSSMSIEADAGVSQRKSMLASLSLGESGLDALADSSSSEESCFNCCCCCFRLFESLFGELALEFLGALSTSASVAVEIVAPLCSGKPATFSMPSAMDSSGGTLAEAALAAPLNLFCCCGDGDADADDDN